MVGTAQVVTAPDSPARDEVAFGLSYDAPPPVGPAPPEASKIKGPRGDVNHKKKDHLPPRSASLRRSLPASRDLLVMVHPNKYVAPAADAALSSCALRSDDFPKMAEPHRRRRQAVRRQCGSCSG